MSDCSDRQHSRLIRRVAAAAFSDATGSIIDTHSVVKALAIAVTAEIVALTMLVVAQDKVVEFIQEKGPGVLVYGALAFFFLGFFIGFPVYRLFANKWPHRGMHVLIWLVAFAAGLSNIAVALVLFAFEWR